MRYVQCMFYRRTYISKDFVRLMLSIRLSRALLPKPNVQFAQFARPNWIRKLFPFICISRLLSVLPLRPDRSLLTTLSYDNCGAYKLQLMAANIHKADQSFSGSWVIRPVLQGAIKPTDPDWWTMTRPTIGISTTTWFITAARPVITSPLLAPASAFAAFCVLCTFCTGSLFPAVVPASFPIFTFIPQILFLQNWHNFKQYKIISTILHKNIHIFINSWYAQCVVPCCADT